MMLYHVAGDHHRHPIDLSMAAEERGVGDCREHYNLVNGVAARAFGARARA